MPTVNDLLGPPPTNGVTVESLLGGPTVDSLLSPAQAVNRGGYSYLPELGDLPSTDSQRAANVVAANQSDPNNDARLASSDVSEGIDIPVNPPRPNSTVGDKVLWGIKQGAADMVKGITSPLGLGAIGASVVAPPIAPVVAGAFSLAGGYQAGQQAERFGTAAGAGDVATAAREVTGLAANVGMLVGAPLAVEKLRSSGAPLTAEAILNQAEKLNENKVAETSALPVVESKPAVEPTKGQTQTGTPQPSGADSGQAETHAAEVSNIQTLTDAIKELPTSDPRAAVRQGVTVGEVLSKGKEALSGAFDKARATAQSLWDAYRKPPEYTDYTKLKGQWQGAQQVVDHEVMQWMKEIDKKVDPKSQEAIVNYIQANGDMPTLEARAEASKPQYRDGYLRAMELSDSEKAVADNVQTYLDSQLKEGLDNGLLSNGIENYVTQIWKDPNPVSDTLVRDANSGALNTSFPYARQRVFDSYFEGELAGYEPRAKNIKALVGAYDRSFRKAMIDRKFVSGLSELKASDNRPAVAVTGSGVALPEGVTPPEAMMVRATTTPEEASDYLSVNHPALRKWNYVSSVGDTPIIVQGEMKVHPEIYKDLKNVLGTSALRDNPVTKTALNAQSAIKQTMLSISGFHQVQEGTHALGHGFMPWKTVELDLADPIQRSLVDHGLQIASMDSREIFDEGLSGGDFWNRAKQALEKIDAFPSVQKGLGEIADYTDWLFGDYIPRLKMTLATAALERNRVRYGDKLSEDQLLKLSADQSNAAFGELNYKMMGRNKTFQDVLRLFALAPDFMEARLKFTGQAITPYHREQLMALARLGIGQYVAMRLMNQAFDDDPHWEKPFSFVYNGREYSLRTVPEDILRASQDSRKFVYNRLSPLIGRGGIQLLTGRDAQGVKRTPAETIAELGTSWIPISMRSRDDLKIWESFMAAFGVFTKGYSATQEVGQLAREWSKSNLPKSAHEDVYDYKADPFRPIRNALQNDDPDKAKEEYQKLSSDMQKKVREHFSGRINAPFTGSNNNEQKFKASLTQPQLEAYSKAIDERRELAQKFLKSIQP